MLNISGITIQAQIYESANSLVYRGLREEDSQPLILKILKENYPTPQELARYRTEYQITKSLNLPGIVKVYDLQKYQNTLVMLLEDFGGEALKIWSQQHPFTLSEFLPIAIKVTEILGQIHVANIIHKDINPSNIVFNRSTGELKIIDFGISTQLTRENTTLKNPNILEGTLAYISPEQTGRMNRPLDYRTDFYSLGITFYELLTNQLPFTTNDALELVHCHIAKQPLTPSQLNPEIPQIISYIVMKLMAKTAEDRYQSAWGLQADLQICLTQLNSNGNILEFPLAVQDISDKFQIPQKLYGRELEIETLLSAFERVQSQSEMILVAGYSGIGKSALIQEIYQPITEKRGYFISGKFDQYQRNIPYSALVLAFQQLVKQLLAEPEEKLQEWKTKLLNALGINGQIIIDIIPEVKLIIGVQPEVLEVGGNESQNRFKLVFKNFIKVFTNPEHPLALFLDDLQWADRASLELIKILMTGDVTGLFLMGAYRDNEVSAVHPLMLTLEEMTKAGVVISNITLSPLNLATITKILTDTLKCTAEKARPLAELVQRKTGGNPFFMNEFLKSLYTENLLSFEHSQSTIEGRWQWSLEEIEARGFTDNVLELMTDKIKKLPINTQDSLKVAASIGNKFDLKTLALYWEKPERTIANNLYEAVNFGLIIPLINKDDLELFLIEQESQGQESNLSDKSDKLLIEYKFIHDRVQQAAYALIDERERKFIHLQIGKLLQKYYNNEEKLFDLVEHLNLAQELITNEPEKFELATLNLIAARQAKESTAYAAAQEYLITGINLLSGDFWQDYYELAINLHKDRAEIEYLNGNFELAETLINQTIERCQTNLEKAELYNILIIMLTMMSKFEEAVATGRKALALFDIYLADTDLKNALQLELAKVKTLWVNRDIASFLEQPEMTNLEMRAAFVLLVNVDPPAYFTNADLYGIIAAKMAEIAIKYGVISASAKGYTSYGIILSSVLEEYEAGYQFACLGVKIARRFNDSSMKAKSCNNLGNHVQHWVKPMKEAESINNEGYQAGLESGELQFSGYIALHQVVNFFVSGRVFSEILLTLNDYLNFTDKIKNLMAYHSIIACQLPIYNLSGITKNKFDFSNDFLTEDEYIKDCRKNSNFFALCNYLTYKAQVLYLYGSYPEALNCVLEAQTMLGSTQGMITLAVNNFYTSLILIALCPTVAESEKIEYLQQIETNQKPMKIWADNCPENFLHKYLLVAAEIARDAGNIVEAMDLYDRAIKNARRNDYIQEAALANELALKFYLSLDKPKFAQLYLNEAIYCYSHWGAVAKVKDLEGQYPDLLIVNKTKIKDTKTNVSMTNTGSNENLDIATVIKATSAISGEIVLDKLLSSLMKILIENAGAQTGYLILNSQGNDGKTTTLKIEAQGTIDNDQVTVLQSIPVTKSQLISESIVNYVARTNESVVLNDATKEGNFTNDPYVQKHQSKSILCVPLINQGKLISIVYLENNLTVGAFTPKRLEVLKLLSSQAAISLENAKLYTQLEDYNLTLEQKVEERTIKLADANQEITILNERLKAENVRMSAELDVTRKLQQMILPKEEEISEIEGLEIAGFMEPADEVGGDYYDILQQAGKVKICIGDVTGHGLESGMLMIMAQTAVRTLLESNETNPVKFLDILNHTLYKNVSRMNSDKNMTLALLDYSQGTVTISGQHEEVIVVRADGELELIDTMDLGFPIGLELDIADFISQTQVQLHPGDGVVLYTDGITEAINMKKQEYGLERLCEVVSNSWHKSVREIRESVIEDVRRHIGEQKVYDDITLVVLKQT